MAALRSGLSVGLEAIVRNGRLVVDEPTELPDGTLLELVVDDEGDDLDEDGRAALNAAITASLEQARDGRVAPAEKVLETLRSRAADE